MEIANGIKIVDLALYIASKKILVIGDLHLGYEEALNSRGLLIPRFQFADIKQRLAAILGKVSPDIVVINGDLKHEFGTISGQEWRQALGILDFFSGKKVIIVKGNHDAIVGPIAGKRNVEIVPRFDIDGRITIVHGDIIPEKMNKTVIIGHEHPAVSFQTRPDERYKCFLKGRYRKHELIVMPSFNLITEGTDITRENPLSPFLMQDLSAFEVFVVEKSRVYDFGRLGKIQKRNI